jgi:hypothetical protein
MGALYAKVHIGDPTNAGTGAPSVAFPARVLTLRRAADSARAPPMRASPATVARRSRTCRCVGDRDVPVAGPAHCARRGAAQQPVPSPVGSALHHLGLKGDLSWPNPSRSFSTTLGSPRRRRVEPGRHRVLRQRGPHQRRPGRRRRTFCRTYVLQARGVGHHPHRGRVASARTACGRTCGPRRSTVAFELLPDS